MTRDTLQEYVAIENADDVRKEFDEEEWSRVTVQLASPRIFYFRYLSRPLVRAVVADLVTPGMLIDENDDLMNATSFK